MKEVVDTTYEVQAHRGDGDWFAISGGHESLRTARFAKRKLAKGGSMWVNHETRIVRQIITEEVMPDHMKKENRK